ncbi:RidA family protein [Bacteroidota bacterium]
MDRTNINSGSSFEKEMSYSRAVVTGNWVLVSGTTGFNYRTMDIGEDVESQVEQCFVNIADALQKAGSKMEDIVKVQYILPNATDFEKCWPTMKKYLGEVRPAATMISAGLADERMKIEIEVTAFKK